MAEDNVTYITVLQVTLVTEYQSAKDLILGGLEAGDCRPAAHAAQAKLPEAAPGD
ncbi:hypothetical protein [Azospirillum sp. RU38E]|uniref:hypothetical protein n=1 Tax=Azospirillum sp. RU38E TaxID=1907313 RepID=UPI00135A2311|nr:hypothetical protein [Azospirillum sp. RU38E]